ncbi:MAG TPA: hypothetical protein VHJ20_10995 [Polyangia bacterium]|nr:hypothetical protein [Polyangia bacterium]
MVKIGAWAGAIALATAVGLAVFLRPRPVAHEQLPPSGFISPALAAVLRNKMGHHELQMKALVTRVVLLDDDGVARAAGEIFDEPSFARPLAGDELNGTLPDRFFALQDELRTRTRQLVIASGRHDRRAVADTFAELTKTCIACHEVYLRGAP